MSTKLKLVVLACIGPLGAILATQWPPGSGVQMAGFALLGLAGTAGVLSPGLPP